MFNKCYKHSKLEPYVNYSFLFFLAVYLQQLRCILIKMFVIYVRYSLNMHLPSQKSWSSLMADH